MRRAIRLFVLGLCALVATGVVSAGSASTAAPAPAGWFSDACGSYIYKANGSRWACSFVDDFNGTKLDTSKWVVQQTSQSGFTTAAADCYVNSSNNVYVRNGNLNLASLKLGQPTTCASPYGSFTSSYTSGGVASWGKFSQTYGRFEFRAAFPKPTTAGPHSALWLYPPNLKYGGWPASGEIDVAEFFGYSPDHVYPTLHYSGSDTADTGWDCVISRPDNYHTYAVEWSATEMRFIYDGSTCFTRSWTPASPLAAPQPFDQPFMPTMVQAVGSFGNDPTALSSFPFTTKIDYVKVWK